jgi:type VI protein secretion system component VasK
LDKPASNSTPERVLRIAERDSANELMADVWRLGVEAGRHTSGARWVAATAATTIVALVLFVLTIFAWARAAHFDEIARLERQRADTKAEFEIVARECAAQLRKVDELLGVAKSARADRPSRR